MFQNETFLIESYDDQIVELSNKFSGCQFGNTPPRDQADQQNPVTLQRRWKKLNGTQKINRKENERSKWNPKDQKKRRWKNENRYF